MNNLIGKTILERYQVHEKLGSGGMAEVYKVWDQSRNVFLAAKFIQENMAMDLTFMRRFEREADTLKKLQHPHIVRFYDLEQDEAGLAFMLLDYVEGSILQRVIFEHKGFVPIALVTAVMQGVCSALQYAHNLGLVHMDIKPSNVMRDAAGKFVLADFGISRVTETATATMVGTGTPAYMAPEQIRGEDPLPQADMYPLGIVLYEMLTGGERPFKGERATITGSTAQKVIWEHLNLEPRTPREINPNISPALEAVILRCMEKDPARRYADMTELFNAYNEAVNADAPLVSITETADETVDALAVPAPIARPPRTNWMERVPSWAWVSVGLVVVLGVFLLALSFSGNLSNLISFDGGSAGRNTEKNEDEKPEDEEPVVVVVTATAESVAEIPTQTLTQLPPPATVRPTVTVTPAPIVPDGKIVFFSNRDGDDEIYTMKADGSDVRQLTNNNTKDWHASLSSDGDWIVFVSLRDGIQDLYLMDENGNNVKRLTDTSAPEWGPVISPDGQKIAFYSVRDGDDRDIYVMDINGKNVKQLTFNGVHDYFPSWSPDSQKILFYSFSDGDRDIYVMDADGDNVVKLTDNKASDYFASFSPDGRKIVFYSNRDGDPEIYVMDSDGSNVVRLTYSDGWDDRPEWSPDGKYIVFESDRDGDYEIYIMKADGDNVQKLTSNSGSDEWPDWSP